MYSKKVCIDYSSSKKTKKITEFISSSKYPKITMLNNCYSEKGNFKGCTSTWFTESVSLAEIEEYEKYVKGELKRLDFCKQREHEADLKKEEYFKQPILKDIDWQHYTHSLSVYDVLGILAINKLHGLKDEYGMLELEPNQTLLRLDKPSKSEYKSQVFVREDNMIILDVAITYGATQWDERILINDCR